MYTMEMICLNSLVCATFIFAITVVNSTTGSHLEILKKRVVLIEKHLRDEIYLLREEFGLEIDEIKEIYKSVDFASIEHLTDGGETSETSDRSVTLSMLESVEKDIQAKIAQLQKGFQSEKIWRRDVQHQLQNNQQSILKNIENKISELNGSRYDLKPIINITSCSQYELKTEVQFKEIIDILKAIKNTIHQTNEDKPNGTVGVIENRATHKTEEANLGTDCVEMYKRGHVTSGVYEILPSDTERPLHVYCDMETDGGGWTVFQRRCDGSENFTRSWDDYRFGFGNLAAEFWLGNEYVSRMTSTAPHELRIELEDFENEKRFAKYSSFSIAPLSELYKLTVGGFSGDVKDSLVDYHTNQQFSTIDKGPSTDCAKSMKGGFWYNDCHYVNINGLYLKGENNRDDVGVIWYHWKGWSYSLKFTEMKFRPK